MTETVIAIFIIAIVFVFHYYLWRKLVYTISTTSSIWFKVGTIITVCSWAMTNLALVSGPYGAPIASLDFLAEVGTRWLGIFIIIVILQFIIDVTKFLRKNKDSQIEDNLNSRSIKKRTLAILIVAMIGVVISMYDNEVSLSKNIGGPSITGSLPFDGRWLVGSTPAQRIPSHGTDMFGVGYAIDFIAVDEKNRTSRSVSWRTLVGTEPPENFYAFGKPVYSPVSGKVVSVHNGEPDHDARRSLLTLIPYMLGQADRIRKGPEAIAGNYVIIAPDNSDLYIAIVHLQLDSIEVKEGQNISEGQYLANCGNSGNSTQPHIHIQAMDSTDFSTMKGVPLYFREFSQWNKGESEPITRLQAFPDARTVVSPK